ncbi:MAG: Cof-type HAD-IIB family hydrolase [Metamycoplasmataceae bacterium]
MKWGNIKIKINKDLNEEFEVECFFIDLDGTTLDYKRRYVSDLNAKKIKEINQQTPVIISTGRSFSNKVQDIMKQLDIEYAICQNGAIIVNSKGEILQNIFIQSEMIKLIKDIAIKHNVFIIPNSKYQVYTNNWYLTPFKWFNKKHYFNLNDFNPNLKCNKLVLAGCSKKKLYKVFLELKEKFPSLSFQISGNDLVIEVTDSQATKGLAAVFVTKLLNVEPTKSVHIGDSMNDTSTINYLGALIAMENSSQHLLNVATHIGPNYKNGGLAKVFDGEFTFNYAKK